ncbi:MAG: arginase family protein [Hyphomicrobiaceae bacterium]
MANAGMSVNLLHLDDALLLQPGFLAACRRHMPEQVDLQEMGSTIRLWADASQLEELKTLLEISVKGLDDGRTVVSWIGSGDFHHVTALLIELIADRHEIPLTVVHFDNHPDWVLHSDGMHCGSWVRYLLDRQVVERVVSIGINSRDLVWPDLKGGGIGHVQEGRHVVYAHRPVRLSPFRRSCPVPAGFRLIPSDSPETGFSPNLAQSALAEVETAAIYVTIDKDVLQAGDAITNWDQGLLRIDAVAASIKVLFAHRHVVGIDVIGDRSRPRYRGSLATQWRKRCEVMIDQPIMRDRGDAVRVNERSNIRLLSEIEAAQC